MATDNHRWLLETGEFTDFRIICGDDGVEFNVHRLMLSIHSAYFARLFKSGFQEATLGVSTFTDVNPQAMERLLDFFYRGNTPWKCADIVMLADVWILADRLQATSAMIEIECCVDIKLHDFESKWIAADWKLLEMVFYHEACAESSIGYAIGEAASIVLVNRSEDPKKTDLVERQARENISLANMMLFWSSRYWEESKNSSPSTDFGASYFMRPQETPKDLLIRGDATIRDRLIMEKMTKPSRIMAK
ncbi:BTB/POZ domain-containing protein [Colletotrichum kahawae]|uniref:BTB/POZ domain-containing protein n=1 Tax=Colletotrichum kahawae TaxID=34407 RepID=A0AAE0DH03_COLKA|nr:BTB/POZ domain-containing protein [Colletotrichum kahawae]